MNVELQAEIERMPVLGPQRLLILLVCLVMLFDGLDIQLASLTAPTVIDEWNVSRSAFAPVLAAALVGMIAGAFCGGWLGDRLGRRGTIIGCVALFGAATTICSLASSIRELTMLRFIGGFGFGAVLPAATALLAEWTPRKTAARAIGILAMGFPLGGMIGGLGASWLLPAIGWQGCYLLGGLLPLSFAILLFLKLPESPAYLVQKGQQDQTRMLLSDAWRSIGYEPATTYRLASTNEAEVRSAPVVGNWRRSLGLWLTFFAHMMATYSLLQWLPVLLVELRLPLPSALRVTSAFNLAMIAGTLFAPTLLNRIGSRPTMIGLAGAAALVMILLAVATVWQEAGSATAMATLLIGISVAGMLVGALITSLFVLAAASYETSVRARGIGIASTFGRLGGISSAFAGAMALGTVIGGAFFWLIALLLVVVIIGTVIVDTHIAPAPNDDGALPDLHASPWPEGKVG